MTADVTGGQGPDIIGLFEGYGGLTMATLAALGGRLIGYSEIEPAACRLLAHHHPDIPNYGDITTVGWSSVPRNGHPLVLTGGFPCQDVSSAGRRRGMRPGTRSGLWSHFAYAIDQLRPDLVIVENVRGLLSADAACDLEPCPWCVGDDEGRPLRALGAVLGDLAELGYDASWCGLRAADVGAPHGRYRIFITAWPAAADTGCVRRDQGRGAGPGEAEGWGSRGGASGRCVDATAPDSSGSGRQGPGREPARRPEFARIGGGAPADPAGVGWGEGRPEPARLVGGPDAPVGGHDATADPDCDAVRKQPVGQPWGGSASFTGHAGTDAVADSDSDGLTGDGLGHGSASEDGPSERLQDLRDPADAEALQREARGPERLPSPLALHPDVRKHTNRGRQECGALAGAEAPTASMRGVRGDDDRSARTPQGPESEQQRSGQLADAVRVVPSEAALARGSSEEAGRVAWGDYEPAIRRWELILGRPAPAPTVTGKRGGQQLSPTFVEFLMGLPEGHVTAVPGLSRNEQLKLLGNGVVPQQATAALRWLLSADAAEVAA